MDLVPLYPRAQRIDNLGGCAQPEVRGQQTLLQFFQGSFVDLVGEGDDVFNPLRQGLAGARDSLLHAPEYAPFLGFFQAAKKGLNHRRDARYCMI